MSKFVDIPPLSEEAKTLLASLPKPNMGAPRRVWTAEENALLLAGWNTVTHKALAKVIGCNVCTARTHYEQLMEEKKGE